MGDKRFFYLIVTFCLALLLAFQNCSRIESFGNGKPYEGIDEGGVILPPDDGSSVVITPPDNTNVSPGNDQAPALGCIAKDENSSRQSNPTQTIQLYGASGESVDINNVSPDGSDKLVQEYYDGKEILSIQYYDAESLLIIDVLTRDGKKDVITLRCRH